MDYKFSQRGSQHRGFLQLHTGNNMIVEKEGRLERIFVLLPAALGGTVSASSVQGKTVILPKPTRKLELLHIIKISSLQALSLRAGRVVFDLIRGFPLKHFKMYIRKRACLPWQNNSELQANYVLLFQTQYRYLFSNCNISNYITQLSLKGFNPQ